MSKYTVTIDELLTAGVDLFNYPYPIYDEAYRVEFETKITDHFLFYEIGQETPGQFIHYLRTRLNEIMPYFNKLYVANQITQRITDNYDMVETFTKTSNEDTSNNATANDTATNNLSVDGTSTGTGDSTDERLFNDTPHNRLDTTKDYLTDQTNEAGHTTTTSVTSDKNTGTVVNVADSTNLGTKTGGETWTREESGNMGVQNDSQAVDMYMKMLHNVDLEVFKALSDLFMQIY